MALPTTPKKQLLPPEMTGLIKGLLATIVL